MDKKTKREKNIKNQKKIVKKAGYSTDGEKVIWRFDMIDSDGKFAFDLDRKDFLHYEVMKKMIDYSNMTWSEIKRQTHDEGKSKHHLLALEELSKEAFERFNVKHLEEYSDSIFSFALQNKLRIVGIRKDANFHVLWYDPQHEVCLSKKKHT